MPDEETLKAELVAALEAVRANPIAIGRVCAVPGSSGIRGMPPPKPAMRNLSQNIPRRERSILVCLSLANLWHFRHRPASLAPGRHRQPHLCASRTCGATWVQGQGVALPWRATGVAPVYLVYFGLRSMRRDYEYCNLRRSKPGLVASEVVKSYKTACNGFGIFLAVPSTLQASYDTPHDWQRDDQMRPLTDKGKARAA